MSINGIGPSTWMGGDTQNSFKIVVISSLVWRGCSVSMRPLMRLCLFMSRWKQRSRMITFSFVLVLSPGEIGAAGEAPYERRHPEDNPSQWYTCSTRSPSAQFPYDLTVCTSLIAFKHHFPEITFISEAEAYLWSDAVHWYKVCFPGRTVLPGPWSPEVARLRLDDIALLDSRAQRIGYRIMREKGVLFLVVEGDRRNILGNNQIFLDDGRGRNELAGSIRYLTETQTLIEPWENAWSQWRKIPGFLATWTTQIAERWLVPSQEYIDVRKIEASDGSGKHAWIPRRALATFIETPDDLKRYRLQLLEKETRWVRCVSKNAGTDTRNPGIRSASLSFQLRSLRR